MTERTLLVLGAGGHGKAVAEAALLSGEWQAVKFADDRWPELAESFGCPVISNLAGLAEVAMTVDAAIAAVGNNAVREQWCTSITSAGLTLASVIHPRAFVSEAATVGEGAAVMAMAMVGVDAALGRGVIVNAGAIVDHDVSLDQFAHLGVGVQLAGGVKVHARAWLQAGCCAGYGVVVEEADVLAPGTVLSA
jgi:sugar O-acyltransferase (sialic acid O-acetyltransferase NeuD family)